MYYFILHIHAQPDGHSFTNICPIPMRDVAAERSSDKGQVYIYVLLSSGSLLQERAALELGSVVVISLKWRRALVSQIVSIIVDDISFSSLQ
jgi:hypothetical protein